MDVLLLAHGGHGHGPDLGLISLLVATAVLAAVLLLLATVHRIRPRSEDQQNAP